MQKLTKAQQKALYAVYDRDLDHTPCPTCGAPRKKKAASSYLKFRRTARIAFGDCLMVPWAGMILGIETDGYTHS